MVEYTAVDCDTWVFEVDGFSLDAPQQCKSTVSDEESVSYENLRAKKIEDSFSTYCVVVRTVH